MSNNRELWIPNEKSKWPGILLKTTIILVIIAGILVVITKANPPEEVTTDSGVARIKEMEAQDVDLAEKYIKSIREQWTEDEAQQIANEAGSLKASYQQSCTLVMGDSIAKGLLDYNVLDGDVVIAAKGASIGSASGTLNSALALSPWNFVMAYGLDDVVSYDGDEVAFIAAYKEIAGTFKAMRPNAKVYICEITPVSSEAVEDNDVYINIKVFNEAIRRLCKKEGYIYLETAKLVSDYDRDGIMPNYSFFSKWADTILQYVNENAS